MLYFYINLLLKSLLKIPSSFPPVQNHLLINIFSPFSFCLYDSFHPSSSSFNTYLCLSLQFVQQSHFESLFLYCFLIEEYFSIFFLTYYLSFYLFCIHLLYMYICVFPNSNMLIYFLLLQTCFGFLFFTFHLFNRSGEFV